MAESNVTPIRGRADGTAPPPGGKPPRRRPKPKVDLMQLRARDSESDGFCTREVISGLEGVCTALAHTDPHGAPDLVDGLSQAAKVLASILSSRIE